jgi:hypothetical protein
MRVSSVCSPCNKDSRTALAQSSSSPASWQSPFRLRQSVTPASSRRNPARRHSGSFPSRSVSQPRPRCVKAFDYAAVVVPVVTDDQLLGQARESGWIAGEGFHLAGHASPVAANMLWRLLNARGRTFRLPRISLTASDQPTTGRCHCPVTRQGVARPRDTLRRNPNRREAR